MSGTVIAIWSVVCLVLILAIVGGAMWLTFRRRHGQPSYEHAQEHAQLREQVEQGNPEATLGTPDYVPADRVNPLDGLTVPQDPDEGPPMGGLSGEARRRPVAGD
jgi:hypothetical protein